MNGLLQSFIRRPEAGALLSLMMVIVLFIVFGDINLNNLIGAASWLNFAANLGIVAIPVGLLMIAGELDISIGAMIPAGSMTTAIVSGYYGLPIGVGMIAALTVGVLVGLTNGYLAVKTSVPTLIITLGTLVAMQGIVLSASVLLTGNASVALTAPQWSKFLFGQLIGGSHQIIILWWVLLMVIFVFVIHFSRYGNWIFALGGDKESARNAGIPTNRLTTLLTGVEIVALSDIDAKRANEVATKIPASQGRVKIYEQAEDLIADSRVEAVVICSWGPAHEQQLLAAIAAGKPVFCEKPLVTSEEAALKVIDAEVAHGKKLVQLGLMRRFDADYRRLKAVIDSGTLGPILMYHSTHRNASVPAGLYTSDMPLNDTLVHDADIARFLLNDEVAGVEVRLPRRSSRGKDLRDPTFVLLHMESGALVDVEISVNIGYGYDIRGEAVGEQGVARLPERPATLVRDVHGVRQAIPIDWRERFIEAYDQEFREWIVAAKAGTAAGPSTWDGYASTLVGDAALRAVVSGHYEAISYRPKPTLYS